MPASFMQKLKKAVFSGASLVAHKSEEAAKVGKLRFELMSENRRLHEKYANLGRYIYQAAENQQMTLIDEENEFIEKVGSIHLSSQRVESLREEIRKVGEDPDEDVFTESEAEEKGLFSSAEKAKKKSESTETIEAELTDNSEDSESENASDESAAEDDSDTDSAQENDTVDSDDSEENKK